MPYQVTRGKAYVGTMRGRLGGYNQFSLVGSIARTDTSAKVLGHLPKDAIITGVTIYSPTVSNAGTTATITVGYSGGSGHEILNGMDVKGSTGSGQQNPTTATGLNSQLTADQTVIGVYAETGTASSAGGPWMVSIEYIN